MTDGTLFTSGNEGCRRFDKLLPSAMKAFSRSVNLWRAASNRCILWLSGAVR